MGGGRRGQSTGILREKLLLFWWHFSKSGGREVDPPAPLFPTPLCWYEVQLWPIAMVQLLNKPYENEVILTMQKLPLKYCWPLETMLEI